MLHQKNTRKQGDVGLGSAIAHFTTQGHTVCIPLTDNQDYDLVVDDGENLQKVQVKTTRHRRFGIPQAQLSVRGGNKTATTVKHFDNTLVDSVFVLVNDGSCYLIPSKAIKTAHSINLGKKYEEFKI